jgi:hypothetical protein
MQAKLLAALCDSSDKNANKNDWSYTIAITTSAGVVNDVVYN